MKIGKEMRYLTMEDVKSLGITMAEYMDIVERVYIDKGNGNAVLPMKHPLHPVQENGPHGHVTAMSAYAPGIEAVGCKVISGFATNFGTDVPYITGLYVLDDVKTGAPLSVMDCVWLTGMRTGAVSGVTAKYLARKDSEVVTIIGCGMQGHVTLDALMCALDNLKEIYVKDVNPETVKRYLTDMREKYPQLKIEEIVDLETCIRKSDIIATCVPSDIDPKYQVVKYEWIKKEGVLLLPVDVGVSFEPDTFEAAHFDKWYTDDRAQYAHFQEEEYVKYGPKEPPELGEMLAGKAPGRESDKENICPVNIGTGLADLAAAKYIYDKAVEKGVGTILQL